MVNILPAPVTKQSFLGVISTAFPLTVVRIGLILRILTRTLFQQGTNVCNYGYITSLPTEVLVLIFQHSLNIDDKYRVGHTTRIVTHLLRVCSLWRQITFRMPELWDTLNV